MRKVIDCNSNIVIDVNLWKVYDFLCERGIAINNVKNDLMAKKKLLQDEKERCEGRGMCSLFLFTQTDTHTHDRARTDKHAL